MPQYLAATPVIDIGAIVRFSSPGGRGEEGERMIPAIVMHVWPDQSLQLFALQFEGSFLVNSIPRERVEPVLSAAMLAEVLTSIEGRLRALEAQLAGRAREVEARVPAPGTLAHTFAAERDKGEPLKFQLQDDFSREVLKVANDTIRDQSGSVARG